MIDGRFLTELLRRWHGYAPPAEDAAALAKFLAPTEASAAALAENVAFDDAPSDYARVVARLAARAGEQ